MRSTGPETDTAASTVRADAAGIGAGYQPGTVQDLDAVLAALTDLRAVRGDVSSRAFPESQMAIFNILGVSACPSIVTAADGSMASISRTNGGSRTSSR